MQATPTDLAALLEVQQIDLAIMQLNKQLDELPQRQKILAARNKLDAIRAKLAQAEILKKEVSKKLSRIDDEDASLAKKENGVQAAIEAAGGDYRNVEARTKELEGIFKRRATLEESRATVKAELDKLNELVASANAAIDEVSALEQAQIASFQKEGGELKAKIAEATHNREALFTQMAPELADEYEKTAKRLGSVAVGELDGTKCGVCRAPIDSGRLIQLKAQAPVGICPNCKRMLIIR